MTGDTHRDRRQISKTLNPQLNTRHSTLKGRVYASLGGVEVGDGLPVAVVGAINVSPESFYAASVPRGRRALEQLAVRMVREGAAILDIGAMSTAPYVRAEIDASEEARRMAAAVRTVRQAVGVPISADTQRAGVAAEALAAGATIINDVSGLWRDPAMAAVARCADGVILMACEQRRSTEEPIAMIVALLGQCMRRARAAGIAPTRVVLDPGIGFFRRAKLPWHQLDCEVIDGLARFRRLGRPLLVGISRKSFIGALTGRAATQERLYGSLAAAAIAVYRGASLVRTHDVAATLDVVRVVEAIRGRGTER